MKTDTIEMTETKISEQKAAEQIKDVLAKAFPEFQVETGKNLLYKIEIDGLGRVTHEDADTPSRGQFAFQTDILISQDGLPLVVIELKSGSFSTHDVIVYSMKAQRHKQIYAYLRYGFVVYGAASLGRRFMTHNENFDFALAAPDMAAVQKSVVNVVRRQIAGAQRLRKIMSTSRVNIERYEQIVEIDGCATRPSSSLNHTPACKQELG